ncbi:MAG: serine/threonine-protein kinase [Polyangiaceae bacterium]
MNVRERSAPVADRAAQGADAPSRPDAGVPIPADLAARYTPLFEIGRGGMGTIEVALQRSTGDGGASERIVALKRMHPHSARERRQTEAFLREARLAASLIHPNVVHAFDFGEIDGELFLAMEYVEGETLSAIVRTARDKLGGLPPALVASMLADACDGLHAAHELRDSQTGALLNVIHRDVSPHNVMVSYEGHVKLLDFGVAKMDSVDPLTRTGEVKGKTAYMSPEQAMGETLDRRSDLFAVGAVLFECVSGQRMYGTGTDLEILRRLALGEPPSLLDASPLAPPALVDLHARLVAHDRDKRPATAALIARELREYVVSTGVHADAEVIADVMGRLFAYGAAERKRLLNEALGKQVPAGRVEVLRRSLAGPTALAALGSGQGQSPRSLPSSFTSNMPTQVAPPSLPPMGEPLPPRATRSGVIASALVGLAIAGGIVAFSTTRGDSPPPLAPAPPPTAATATPTPTAAPTSTAASTSTLTPTPTSTSTPAPSTPTPTPTAGRPSPRATPHPRHPKPAASSSHVDVDTNPL